MSEVVNQIFIGGFGGTGSRVVAEIFDSFGYYVSRETGKDSIDFGAGEFVNYFDRSWKTKDFTTLITYMNRKMRNNKHFALKHGHFMFIDKELKKFYPGCKTVYVMRHPIDAAAGESKRQYIPHIKYGGLKNTLDNKIKYYIEKSIQAYEESDLVIKYEDLCSDTENQLKIIREFTGKHNMDLPSIDIRPSKTTGIHTDLYDKYDTSMLGY
jgi:hypothetical protein